MSGSLAKPYHHGDLRKAALAAALDAIEAVGPENLSLRQVAEAVGVTHRALARPFGDRAGLLRALATEGYHLFRRELDQGGTDIESFADAYVGFARGRPKLYALMMTRPEGGRDETLLAAQWQVIDHMRQVFGSDEAAKRAWLILHGGVSLSAAEMLAPRERQGLKDFLVTLIGD